MKIIYDLVGKLPIKTVTVIGFVQYISSYFYTLTTEMGPPGGKKIFGYLQYPRSGALQKFCVDLKVDPPFLFLTLVG